jgi:hypothetical protein
VFVGKRYAAVEILMNPTLQAFLTAWGAVLSTTLAVLQVVKHFRDKPDLRVYAELNFTPVSPDEETKGRKVATPQGLQEALILVRVSNAGQKPSQVAACYVQLRGPRGASIVEVITDDMPTILNPNSCAQYFLQTEWLEMVEVRDFGVLDGSAYATLSPHSRFAN